MLIPSFWPLVGGAERQLMTLLRNLPQSKVLGRVVTRRIPNTLSEERIESISIKRCYCLNGSSIAFFFSSLCHLISKNKEFDILHVHTINSPIVAGVIIKRLFRKPLIVKIPRTGLGSSFSAIINKPIRRAIFKKLSKYVDSFIALNREAKIQLEELDIPAEKIQCIPNSVDTKFFNPIIDATREEKKKQLSLPGDKLITCVGRLIARKKIDVILSSMSAKFLEDNDAYIAIVGSGPEEQELRKAANDNKISQRVLFLGEKTREEVRDILQVSDIFYLGSDSEGMSNALLEAMACGVIPVCSKIIGNEEVVEDKKTGFLFLHDNASQLRLILEKIVTKPECVESMKSEIGKSIREQFSSPKVAEQYTNLYAELIKP